MLRGRTSLILPLLLCLAPSVARGSEPHKFPEGKQGNAELAYRNGLPVLIVGGTPEEIGTAVGKLALKPSPRIQEYPAGVLKEFGAEFLAKSFLKTGQQMFERFPKDYKTELEAMVKAAGVSRDKLIFGNTLFDIKKIILCSSLMIEPERSETGGPLLGRNLDYPSLGWIHEHSLVTVYRPNGKRAWASIGFPGLIGSLSGMNDAGLTVAVLEVMGAKSGEGPRFNPKGMPYALCFRKLLEECATIDEALKLLRSLPRTSMMNLVVADKQGVGVFEITPKSVVLRRGERGVCACCNHFCTELKAPKQMNVGDTFGRIKYLRESRGQEGKIGIEDVHRKLHAVSLGNLTLQTMVFEPETLKLHLAIGETPASKGPLRTLDLKPLFESE